MSMDIQKLKVLAEAATNGPWIAGEEHESHSFEGYTVGDSEGWVAMLGTANEDGRNADFIAASNPAAVLDLIAEIERLKRFETAYKEFSDKTAWVRPNAATQELGMHVADILRKRCDDLTSHNQAQADEIVRLRKQIEDSSPFKNAPLTGPDLKCLACGGYHYGMSGLPCPKMRAIAHSVQEPRS